MFIIKVSTRLPPNYPLRKALDILSPYKIQCHSLYITESESVNKELIIVDGETRKGDLKLAEMAFQMCDVFKQEGSFVCDVCKEKGEHVCGHLAFIPI